MARGETLLASPDQIPVFTASYRDGLHSAEVISESSSNKSSALWCSECSINMPRTLARTLNSP